MLMLLSVKPSQIFIQIFISVCFVSCAVCVFSVVVVKGSTGPYLTHIHPKASKIKFGITKVKLTQR